MQQNAPIPRILIEEELDRILNSRGFVNSPILCRFLRFIVTRTLDGSEREIKEYTIGLQVLDKQADFNRTTDPSVRIHAIRLRKQLEDYYAQHAQQAVIHIDIPKGTYVPVFSLMSSRPAMVDLSLDNPQNRKWRKKICVMPFDVLQRCEHDHFATAHFETHLTSLVAHFQELETIPHKAVKQKLLLGQHEIQAVRELGAHYYFTGSVAVEDGQIHLSVRLYESEMASLVWSHLFHVSCSEGETELLLNGMAEQVASAVCGYTGVLFSRHYLREPEQGFTSREAEALHCYYRNQIQNNPDTFQYALRRVEELVKKGGPCVWCFAILATLYIDGIVYGYIKSEDHLDEAKAFVDRALAIDPQNQHALFALAWWSTLTGESGRTSDAISRMIRVNPHSTFFKQVMAMGICFLGDYQGSTAVMREVLENTPVQSWWIHIPHTITCLKQRDFREALFHARMIGRLSTIFDGVFEVVALYHLGEYDEMVNLLMRYQERFPLGLKHLRRTFSLIFHDEDLKLFLNDTIAGIMCVMSRNSDKLTVNPAGQVH